MAPSPSDRIIAAISIELTLVPAWAWTAADCPVAAALLVSAWGQEYWWTSCLRWRSGANLPDAAGGRSSACLTGGFHRPSQHQGVEKEQ